MKKIIVLICLTIALTACLALCAYAESAADAAIEALIHQALLDTMPPQYYPECECFAEKHAILGMEEAENTLKIYLEASVGGYGFMGGGFTSKSGWGAPCTVILEKQNGEWVFKETLEIEDYSEIPDIMPKWAEKRFFAGDAEYSNNIEDQLNAYLLSINRTEPIVERSQVSGQLPNILTHASNMTLRLRDNYPIGQTTDERIEDGVRVLYINSWAPDEESVLDPTYETEYGKLFMRGTTGRQILQKMRKDDGEVLESIVIRAELYKLTVTVQDDYGSIEYVLEYDGWAYRQPVVTREGACRVDVARFEQECAALEPADMSEMAMVSQSERFRVARGNGKNALIHELRQNGEWTEEWRNDSIIPDKAYDWFTLDVDLPEEPSFSEYGRFSVQREQVLSIYAGYDGEDHHALSVEFERRSGGDWKVTSYSDNDSGLHLYLFDNKVLYYAADFSAMQTAGLSFDSIERSAAQFSIAQAEEKRAAFADALADAAPVETFGGIDPLYIAPGRKATYPVYTEPDTSSPREANGKATVSLNDWVALLDREGDWVKLLYETGKGTYRVGWVDAGADEVLCEAAQFVIPLDSSW